MSLQARIQDVFDEPACDKNQAKSDKERKKGCSKPLTPGAAAGGCAYDGAKIVLQPIVDAAHLVHGPLACEGNGWDNRHAASSGPQLYRMSFTTDMSELDIVMGQGEKKLFRSRRGTAFQKDRLTCLPDFFQQSIILHIPRANLQNVSISRHEIDVRRCDNFRHDRKTRFLSG